MNDLTQEQADRLAKWRWGPDAAAWQEGVACYVSVPGQRMRHRFADTFTAAFRASMQSPMTDRDAELEAKLRWGMDAKVLLPTQFRRAYTVVGAGRNGWGSTWEAAFEDADRMAVGVDMACGTAATAITLWSVCAACDRLFRGVHTCSGGTRASRPDLTPEEATAEAKRLWGDGYAFPAVGKAPLAVGCPGKAYGTGKTFRDALARAESNRVFRALATAFGTVGCAAVRERNKAVGQAMMEVPEWAYRKGWQNAVMAAVEWGNNQYLPIGLWDLTIPLSERLTNTIRAYHEDRLTWCEKSARKRCGGGTFAAAVCAAYERGRPGGGR